MNNSAELSVGFRYRCECSFDLEHKKGTFSLCNGPRQLLHSSLKFVWKSSRVETAREKRPVAAKQSCPAKKKAKKKNDPGTEDVECVRVWSLQSPGDAGGEAVRRLDGG